MAAHLWDLSTEGTTRQWAGANLQCELVEFLCPKLEAWGWNCHTPTPEAQEGAMPLTFAELPVHPRLGKGQRTSHCCG